MNEQDIRIESRNWCGAIETDRGASENQVENIALHFFDKGKIETEERILKIIDDYFREIDSRNYIEFWIENEKITKELKEMISKKPSVRENEKN